MESVVEVCCRTVSHGLWKRSLEQLSGQEKIRSLEPSAIGLSGETGTASNVFRTAAGAAQSGLDGSRLPRPSFLVAKYDEAAGVENGHTLASAAIDAETVSLPTEITDVIKPFVTHGFRLTAQTIAEQAVSRAAKAATMGASRTIIAISESRSFLFHICSE